MSLASEVQPLQSLPNATPVSIAREAKRAADSIRLDVMTRLAAGRVSVPEIVELAGLIRPIRTITVVRLLSDAGFSPAAAQSVADELIGETSASPIERRKATVGWVMRSPRRVALFLDRSSADRRAPPTAHFPFSA